MKATPALKKKSELLFVPFFQLSKSTFLRAETILQQTENQTETLFV